MPISIRFNGMSVDEIAASFLKLDASNGPLTGKLTITPASDTTAIEANKALIIKAGEKLIFDGA